MHLVRSMAQPECVLLVSRKAGIERLADTGYQQERTRATGTKNQQNIGPAPICFAW
jgi:hypothetical protein